MASDNELNRLTAEWLELSYFVHEASGPEFWMSDEHGRRLDELFEAVLRDSLGRVAKAAAPQIGTRWGANAFLDNGVVGVLRSGVFAGDGHLDENETRTLEERAKGEPGDDDTVIGLKRPLRELLQVVGAEIRARRNAPVETAPTVWHNTRKSVTRAYLNGCVEVAMPVLKPVFDRFIDSFTFIPLDQLGVAPGELGWVGWSAERVEAPFTEFAKRFGLNRRQAAWMVCDAVHATRIGTWLSVSSICDCVLREQWPPAADQRKGHRMGPGAWLDEMGLRNAGGLWVPRQDAAARAQLELALTIFEMTTADVTEAGVANTNSCAVLLKEALPRANKLLAGTPLRYPMSEADRVYGWDRPLDLVKLAAIVAELPTVLAVAPTERAWSGAGLRRLPEAWLLPALQRFGAAS